MSSITLDRPETGAHDVPEVDEFREHGNGWSSQTRVEDRAGTDTDAAARPESRERSYDHGDAPPGAEPDGTVDDEFANPT
jgi:hypothetical protein